ncbi:MAG TPA: aromatic ring-hydroxylating dioxygenase subunit alpha [Steroidobacteraceae bacterium]|nr:aromatic ring-hydroxylating dioxygenase subunit alpha [Steroidobacteraceae bacterium]
MTPYSDDLTALLERDQGLPGRYFTDEALFGLERERVLGNSWLCIGLSADVSRKGDCFPVTVLGQPLLMVRDGATLRVFHNVCSHRGAVLVDSPARGRARIVCPYHSWTYRTDGELAATPHFGGSDRHAPDLDRRRLGLRSVPCAEWAGHVFVNLAGGAAPFAEWIRPVAKRYGQIAWADLVHDPALARSLAVHANWKIIAENFVESYHLPWVHPTLHAVNPMRQHYQILGGHSYLGQGGTGYQGEQVAGGTLPLMKGLEDYSRYEALFIFPNLILGPLPDMAFSIILSPEAAERTAERLEFFFVGNESLEDRCAAARASGARFIADVNAQDIGIVESVQRGRWSRAFEGGQFSPAQEATSLQLQKMVAARILSADRGRPEDIVSLPTRDIGHPPRVS